MQVASRFRRPLLIALTGACVAAPGLAAPAVAGVAAGPVVGSVQTLDTSQYSPDNVRVGIDGSGTATAFWTTSEGSAPLKYAVRPAGGQFGFARSVRSAGQVAQSDRGSVLAMAEAANGAALVAWAGDNQVRYTTRSGGDVLFAPAQGAGHLGDGVAVHEIDVDLTTDGRVVAVWIDQASDGLQTVRGVVGRIGQPWAEPVVLDAAPSGTTLSFPQVEMDGTGRVMAVWSRDNAGFVADQVMQATAPADGGFGTKSEYASVPKGPTDPSLAVNAAGAAVVSFHRDEDGVGETILVGSGDVSGSPASIQALPLALPPDDAHLAAVDDDGVAAVLVSDQDQLSDASLYAFVSDGHQDFSGSAKQVLSPHGTDHGPDPYRYELALSAGDGFTATWSGDQAGDDGDEVWSASTTDGVFGPPTQLSSSGTERVWAARNASGDVVTAWDHEDVATPVQATEVAKDLVDPVAGGVKVAPDPVVVGRTLKITFTPSEDVLARVSILSADRKALVKNLRARDLLTGGTRALTTWNGTKAGGGRVKPGRYTCRIQLVDAGGNKVTLDRTVRVVD